MDPSAHHQILYGNYKATEPMNGLSNPQTQTQDHQLKKPRPQPSEQSLKCPRCDSTNTKFCYYNNYSLSQPRYFCKSCRRYWTKGGTLRNIPVGGGCRKNKRSSSSSSMTARSSRATPEPIHDIKTLASASFGDYNDQIDLGLAFSLLNKQPPGSQLGFPTEFGGSLDDVWRKSSNGVFGLSQNERSVENVDFAFGNANAGGMDQVAGDPNIALWGYPWQMNGESFKMMNMVGFDNQIDSRREIWSGNNNGLPNSSWHGMLNSGALF